MVNLFVILRRFINRFTNQAMEKIKNYLLILLVAVGMATAISACSDDKDNNYSELIVGTWFDNYPTDGITFKSDGSFIRFESDDYEEPEPGKWSISGSKLTLDFGGDLEVHTIKVLTEDKLVLEYEDDEILEFEKR